jgi:sulfur carrier protein
MFNNLGARFMSTISVNGKNLQTTHQTVQLVINELGLSQGRYAVEVDGELIPKSELAQLRVVEGMNIEVVQAVGGG